MGIGGRGRERDGCWRRARGRVVNRVGGGGGGVWVVGEGGRDLCTRGRVDEVIGRGGRERHGCRGRRRVGVTWE